MEICKEFKLFSKEVLIDIVVISIIGTILHFAYEFTGRNLLIALFTGVNQSLWENIKIAVIPTYIVALVKMSIQERRKYNLWTALFFKVISIIIIIPIINYFYIYILGYESLIINIVIFYIAILISEIIEMNINNKLKISAKVEDVFKYLNLGIIIFFVIFTFFPPRLEMFKDKLNNKFGI